MSRFALSAPVKVSSSGLGAFGVTVSYTTTPPPPPPPPPAAVANSYRNAQPYLFSSLAAGTIPNRLPGGFDFQIDGSGNFAHGPTRDYVDWGGWIWDNAGGDWIDAQLTRMGTTPWASRATPNAADDQTYTANVTEALRYCVQVGRWNAWIVRTLVGASAREVYGRFASNAAYRPRIDVTYTDATTATLACRVSAYMSTGSSTPLLTGAYHTMGTPGTGGLALEFDRPTKPVQTATLYFTVYRHWGGAATFEFNLADPPTHTDPVEYGVAQGYPLDAGLSGHPSIIGQHRYHDGSVLDDFVSQVVFDTEAISSFSPDLTGGAADTSKLPYRDLGKWIGGAGFYGNAMTIVSSSYSGNGYSPVAPGVGAMRVVMPRRPGVGDGYYDPGYGEGAANTFIMMPAARFGLQRRLFTRYYLRIGTTSETGDPYNVTTAQHWQYNRAGGSPAWAAMGGKCGIGAAHKTRSGGNSGQAGGGHGWSLRWENGILHYDPQSPAFGGWGRSLSWTDYQDNNVVGHRYGSANQFSKHDEGLGQRGGYGAVMYANRWYCIEEEIYLNSVNQASGAGDGKFWTPDGYYKAWIDGRLAYSKSGLVFRSLPLENWFPSLMGTVREVGIAHLWFNWFNGGTTNNAVDQVIFISALAYGEAYIGPMVGAYPTWRAA